MKYAFTITTNNRKLNADEAQFRIDMLRYIMITCGYDVRDLVFTIEHASVMGYHAHGIFNNYVKPVKDKLFYMYLKPLLSTQDEQSWIYYMDKDTKLKQHEFIMVSDDDDE